MSHLSVLCLLDSLAYLAVLHFRTLVRTFHEKDVTFPPVEEKSLFFVLVTPLKTAMQKKVTEFIDII